MDVDDTMGENVPTSTIVEKFDKNDIPLEDFPSWGYPNRVDYNNSTLDERREYLKKQVMRIKFDEDLCHQNWYLQTHFKIYSDPELVDFEFKPSQNMTRAMSIRVMSQKACASVRGETNFLTEEVPEKKTPEGIANYKNSRYYEPPSKRNMISLNITLNNNWCVPVYCDIPGNVENVIIPDSLLFHYSDVNYVECDHDSCLKDAKLLTEDTRNQIKCDCFIQNPKKLCYNNPKCPCFIANKKLQLLQSEDFWPKAQFSTCRPIIFTQPFNNFFETVGFSCSDSCGCKGHCDNNVVGFLEKRLFPFEIYRKSIEIGFEVRSQGLIPAGTPIMELTGKLISADSPDAINEDYAYQLTYSQGDESFWKLAKQLNKWTPKFKTCIDDLSKSDFYLDTEKIGNLARFCNHSCAPSCEIVRVFQKSITPLHARLILVTVETIYPGGEITLDYGPDYLKNQLKGECRCGTFACANGPDQEYYSKLHYTELGLMYCAFDKKRTLKLIDTKKEVEDTLKYRRDEQRRRDASESN